MGGWLECVELLLAHGADPEAMDGEGRYRTLCTRSRD